MDKIICEGWDRVLFCQVNNSENVSYLLDLRKSCLPRKEEGRRKRKKHSD